MAIMNFHSPAFGIDFDHLRIRQPLLRQNAGDEVDGVFSGVGHHEAKHQRFLAFVRFLLGPEETRLFDSWNVPSFFSKRTLDPTRIKSERPLSWIAFR